MPKRSSSRTGSELFIVDNSEDDWKALRYLHDWCQISSSIDIASGFFEVGALLALDGEWQKLDKIRILMGDEVSRRTKRAFESALSMARTVLDGSLEAEKQKNHFLKGVATIVEALRSGKIECRVYRKDKFHAKAYITHARMEVVGSTALVGSSNFTLPGLTDNVELNVQITGSPVAVLQEWYEEHWEEAEDVTPDILRTFERHIHKCLPFDVYTRSLQQYFLGHEESASEWEKRNSRIYPVLARYQKDGYGGLLKRAEKHGGAFLCDGVGLGKTFIGLMLIERFAVHEKKNVALFVPKSGKAPVWERELRKRLGAWRPQGDQEDQDLAGLQGRVAGRQGEGQRVEGCNQLWRRRPARFLGAGRSVGPQRCRGHLGSGGLHSLAAGNLRRPQQQPPAG